MKLTAISNLVCQCPPCRGFTPVLAEFYSELKASNEDDLEIVFVSSDHDKPSFREYFVKEMPWTAVPFDNAAERQNLSSKFGVRGIPAFIIVDPKTGRVIDADGRTTVAQANGNVSRALAKWHA